MTGERSFAYAGLMRSLRRLEAIGGLLPDEGDQIRAAADSLLFADDDARSAAYVGASFDELGSVKHALALIEGLVELGRWPAPMARRTLDGLAACGPAAMQAVPVRIETGPGMPFVFGRRSPGHDPRRRAA